jgi:hypothetical protein
MEELFCVTSILGALRSDFSICIGRRFDRRERGLFPSVHYLVLDDPLLPVSSEWDRGI